MVPMLRSLKRVHAFTLVELLVVMAIITILVAVLLPALSRAQQIAKSSSCKANLKTFGQGLTLYSNQADGFYCSGSFSPRYELMQVTKIGWVADLVNGGFANVFDMNCPSNEAQFSEAMCEMLTATDGGYRGGDQEADNADEIAKIVKQGYMTNFVATWYLCRTAMMPNAWESFLNGTDKTPPTTNDDMRVDYADNSYGPLTQRILDNSVAVASMVPFIADGNLGDFSDATLDLTTCGPFKKGEIGVECTSDGPRKWRQGTDYWCNDEDATQIVVTLSEEENGSDEMVWVGQDYVDFGAIHGGGAKRWCNVLFADGHAASVHDRDNDTVIGFTGNQNKAGDFTELDNIFSGRIVSKRRTGTL